MEHARSFGLTKDSPLNPGDVIEIQGPAVSGKTHFLYHLAAHCLLPKELDVPAKCTVHLGGWQSSVVVLDCDARWNLSRLRGILITRLNMACGEENTSFIDTSAVALESLSRLHIFRPQSSIQLAATLENLPKYHMEKMPEENIRFLFVDSISSFHWIDKWQPEPSAPKAPSFRLNPQKHILRSLQSFKLSHAPIIVLVNWGLYPTSTDLSLDRLLDPFPEQVPRTLYPSLFDIPPRLVVPEESLQVDIHITLFGVPAKTNREAFNLRLEHTSAHKKPESFMKKLRRKEDSDPIEVQGYVRIAPTDDGAVYSGDSFGTFRFRILERDIVAA